MLFKLGATAPNLWNVVENGIFTSLPNIMSFRSKLLRYKFQNWVWRLSYILYGTKWVGGNISLQWNKKTLSRRTNLACEYQLVPKLKLKRFYFQHIGVQVISTYWLIHSWYILHALVIFFNRECWRYQEKTVGGLSKPGTSVFRDTIIIEKVTVFFFFHYSSLYTHLVFYKKA